MAKSLDDIFFNDKSFSFSGWILPNGFVIPKSENLYNHRLIVENFINGVRDYDFKRYILLCDLYNSYQKHYMVNGDIQDSFAVEILGWIQVNNKNVTYRGEKWQDKIIYPLFSINKMKYNIFDNFTCQNSKFLDLYDNIDEIMQPYFEKKKILEIKK